MRDHELNECEEIIEVRPDIMSVERCEECRVELYSL